MQHTKSPRKPPAPSDKTLSDEWQPILTHTENNANNNWFSLGLDVIFRSRASPTLHQALAQTSGPVDRQQTNPIYRIPLRVRLKRIYNRPSSTCSGTGKLKPRLIIRENSNRNPPTLLVRLRLLFVLLVARFVLSGRRRPVFDR